MDEEFLKGLKMISLGYDLATHWCGWGVVEHTEDGLRYLGSGSFELLEASGTTSWKKDPDVIKILRFLHGHARDHIEMYRPQLIGVEVAFGWDKYLAMFFARISTVIALVGSFYGDAFLVHPSTLKLAVAGNGKATKTQVQESICKIFKDNPNLKIERNTKGNLVEGEEDRFDALGCAITAFQYKGVKLDL